jgi:hypothetical protein
VVERGVVLVKVCISLACIFHLLVTLVIAIEAIKLEIKKKEFKLLNLSNKFFILEGFN